MNEITPIGPRESNVGNKLAGMLVVLLLVLSLCIVVVLGGELDKLILSAVLSISLVVGLPGSLIAWNLANRQEYEWQKRLIKLLTIIYIAINLNADFSALALLGVINFKSNELVNLVYGLPDYINAATLLAGIVVVGGLTLVAYAWRKLR